MEFYNNNLEANSAKFMGAIGDINEAFQDERSDVAYYEYLIRIAPTAHEIEILYSIRHDERVHAALLRRLYQEITGIDVSFVPKEKTVIPQSYLDGIKEAILKESREVERYKSIRRVFPIESPYRDTLSRIISDESNHVLELKHILSLTRITNKIHYNN